VPVEGVPLAAASALQQEAVETPLEDVDVFVSTFPDSPFASGVPIMVNAEVWAIDLPSEVGGPTGLVLVSVDGIEEGSTVLNGRLESAAFSVPVTFSGGTHQITVDYAGDDRYAANRSSITVTAGSPSSTALSVSQPSNVFGNPATLTADVTSLDGVPTGVVRFNGLPGGSVDVALFDGTAVLTTSTITPGTHVVTASYNNPADGGSHLPSSSTAANVSVKQAFTGTELTTSPMSPSTAGANVAATVSVTALQTPAGAVGSVTLYDGGFDIGSAPVVGGIATFDLSLTPGQHALQAVFNPGVGFGSSFGASTHTVSPFAVRLDLTASPETSVSGEPVVLTATVPTVGGATPTGTVDFSLRSGGVNGLSFASVPLDGNGVATTPAPLSGPGDYEFIARYSGDTNYAEVLATPVRHTVELASVTLAVDVLQTAPVFGDRLNVAVSIAPAPPGAGQPRGVMTLFANDVEIGAPGIFSSTVNFSFIPSSAGPLELRATYSGNSEFEARAVTADIDIAKRDVAIGVFPPSSLDITYGDTVELDGFVSSGIATTPTGIVELTANGLPIGTSPLDAGGRFAVTTDLIHAGTAIEIVASYRGDETFEPGDTRTTPLRLRVARAFANPVTSQIVGAPAVGDVVTVDVVFDDIGAGATGTVTFSTPDGTLGTATALGNTASFDLVLTEATTWVTASYAGDRNFVQQNAPVVRIDATRATSTISMDDPGTIHYGDIATLRIPVVIPPGVSTAGHVTIYSSQNTILADNVPIVDSVATLPVCGGSVAFMSAEQRVEFARFCPSGTAQLGIGEHELRATFSGNSLVNTSSSTPNEVTVAMAATRVELVASSSNPPYGSLLRLVATVGSTTSTANPGTGEIEFISQMAGSSSGIRLGSAPLVNGVAILEVTADTRLSIDADRVVARYLGQFRAFLPGEGETAVALDRRDVEVTTFVQSSASSPNAPVVGGRSTVEVLIRSLDPGITLPFTGTVRVVTGDGEVCSAQFDPGERRTECQIRWTSGGPQSVTSSYSGDPVHEAGISVPFTFTIGRQSSAGQIVSVPTSVVEETAFPIRWFFNPSLTGTITVLGQPGCVDVPVSAGTCEARLGRAAVGAVDNLMRIRYSGDDNWLGHQFELPVDVRGCYAVEVLSSNAIAGSVSIETATNCATDTSTGYFAGTRVDVAAVANASYEFVRWQSGDATRGTAQATFTVTDTFEASLLIAVFQRACFQVGVVPTRGELDNTGAVSTLGTVTVVRGSNLANGGSFDGICDLVAGGIGFEIGTELSVRAVPELNPEYGEPDIFYGFGTAPVGAVRSEQRATGGTIDFVVDGPITIPAVFGPLCRVVSTSIDPADETAAVEVVTTPDCASPFGDGFRIGTRNPGVTVLFVSADADLFLEGWNVNGVAADDLGIEMEPGVPLGDGDLDIVARVSRCQAVRVIVDGAMTPDQLDGETITSGQAAGTAAVATMPNCPDGSDRYMVGTEIVVEAELATADVVLTWSGNVDVDPDAPTTGTVVVDADSEIVASFFLASVCSLLRIDDPFGLVWLGNTGCGPGYYLDRAKVSAPQLRAELLLTELDRNLYPDRESYERELTATARSFQTRLPLYIDTRTARDELQVYADAQVQGGSVPACFPADCGGPVNGDIYITVSRCQQINATFSVRVKGDTSGAVYPASSIPATTLAFDASWGIERQPLRPWIETRVVSDPIRLVDESGRFTGYERTACESFENVHRPGEAVSIRAGASLPGLYVDGWTGGDTNIPVKSRFGFEFQTFAIAQEGPTVQRVNADVVAICHTLTLDAGVSLIESPPNCPGAAAGENSFIFGSVVRVRQEKYLGNPSSIGRHTQKAFGFTGGVLTGSVTYVRPESEDTYFEPYYEGIVSVDGDKSITVDYRSETDQLESAVVVSLKLIGGVVIAAAPILFTTFVCVPCGVVLGGLAASTFFVDLIPGTDGAASAALDLINPMSVFQCGTKWAANTPTVDPNAPAPPVTVAAEDQLLLDRALALARAEPEFLRELADVLAEAGMLDGPPEDLTVGELDNLSTKADFALTFAKKANTFKKLGVVVYSARWGTRASRLQEVYGKMTQPKGMVGQGFAVVAFVAELHSAGYLDPAGLARNNGEYQDVSDLRGTSNFTDCLDQKYRLAGGT
jgi:hypothetical protein